MLTLLRDATLASYADTVFPRRRLVPHFFKISDEIRCDLWVVVKLACVEMNVHSWQRLVAGTCGHQTRYLDQRFAQKPLHPGKKTSMPGHPCMFWFEGRTGYWSLILLYIWGFWYTSLLPLQKAKKGDWGPALKQVSKEKRCELDGAVRGWERSTVCLLILNRTCPYAKSVLTANSRDRTPIDVSSRYPIYFQINQKRFSEKIDPVFLVFIDLL